jgi:hypothetical protein
LIALALASASISEASTSVQFRASFSPDRTGQRTSAAFDVKISSTDGGVPPPLIAARVRYPAGLAIALSGLGVDACSRLTLEELGIGGCPAGSIMGEGSATAAIQFGPEPVRESAVVTLVRSPEEN